MGGGHVSEGPHHSVTPSLFQFSSTQKASLRREGCQKARGRGVGVGNPPFTFRVPPSSSPRLDWNPRNPVDP